MFLCPFPPPQVIDEEDLLEELLSKLRRRRRQAASDEEIGAIEKERLQVRARLASLRSVKRAELKGEKNRSLFIKILIALFGYVESKRG